jgi:uncharacterized repeat protein (TIGR03803 family)
MTTFRLNAKTSTSGTLRRASLLAAFLLGLSLASGSVQAQTFTVLHQFHRGADGKFPYDALFRDSAGNLYGSTGGGGSFGYGTVFEITAQGKERVLDSFWGGDGLNLWGDLVRDSAGNLYGTAVDGGTIEKGQCVHGCGTVFKLDSTEKLTVLHAFTGGTDGGQPQAGLLRDSAGNLYGTTTIGGDLTCGYGSGCGVVFKIDQHGKETVLHAFSGSADGWRP